MYLFADHLSIEVFFHNNRGFERDCVILLSEMKRNMLQFTIKGIALDNENQLPIIILQNPEINRIIPLLIGPFEASAIIIELEDVKPQRPLTHDLLSEFFIKHNYKLRYIYIYDFIDDNYIAKIIYKKGLKNFSLEIRPSDGIALALRLGSPIYVSPEVADTAALNSHLLENNYYLSDMLYLNHENFDTHIM